MYKLCASTQMELSKAMESCHKNIDGFVSRKDMTDDMKNKKVGQALEYLYAAHDQYKTRCKLLRDDRGRYHAGEDCPGYRPGEIVSNAYAARKYGGDRVGGSKVGSSSPRSPRKMMQCRQIKDDNGRCHAEEGCEGYRPGMFMPCNDDYLY